MKINWLNLAILSSISMISSLTISLNGGPEWLVLASSLTLGAAFGFLQGAGLIDMSLFKDDKK